MSREERFGLGARVDNLLLDLLETLRRATFATNADKINILTHAIIKTDSIRFFVQTAWEAKLISTQQFELVSVPIEDVGKMIGGWRKGLLTKNPPQ